MFCAGLLVLMLMTGMGHADFGRAGVMVSPGILTLEPQNSLVRRCTIRSANYTFSCAPLFFKPDEREVQEAHGPGLTDPETESGSAHLKLADASYYQMEWWNGWDPDKITVRSWDRAIYENPDRKDDYFLGSAIIENNRIILEPNQVYQITAEWIQSRPDDESGLAEYYLITEQMSETEIETAKASETAPYTEDDLRFLTLTLDGVNYTLGVNTPQDLIDNGWNLVDEDDVLVFQDDEAYSDIYATTEHNRLNEPLISLNAMWAYEAKVEYCGFSWHTEENDDSGDDDWDDDPWQEDDPEADEDLAYSMVEWMEKNFPMDTSMEGIYTAIIPLSNGREVEVVNHDSPISLRLLPERAFTPMSSGFWDIDMEGGTYDLGIENRDRIDTDGFFTAEVYQPDLYPAEIFKTLRPGEGIRINGRRVTVTSVEPFEEDGWEIGFEDPDNEGITDYFTFRKNDTEGKMYYATSLEDWVPTTLLGGVKVQLPLPENFTYVTISAGEEVVQSIEDLLELLRNGDMQDWSPYNTSITFENGLPVRILHSGYPSGPDN